MRTVEALLVDYGTAGQGFIVLLVTHQGVHTQDGWKTARRLNDGWRKKHTYHHAHTGGTSALATSKQAKPDIIVTPPAAS